MQKKILWIGLVLIMTSVLQVNAQKSQDAKQGITNRKWFIGSTLLLLGNFDDTNNPEYIQINAGYRITPKDVI